MKLRYWAAMAAFACSVTTAHAQSAGSILLGAGWLHEAPQSSSDPLLANFGGNPMSIPGTGAKVMSSDTLGLNAVYFITDNIAGEFVFGIPPTFDLEGTGQLSSFGKLGSVKQWTPALLLKYYFGHAQSKLRPYLGAGLAYTSFSDPRITSQGFEQFLGGGGTVKVDDAWSPVLNAGLSYQLTDRVYLGASLSYLPMKTTATITPPTLPVSFKANIRVNPIISYLSVAYRF